jgi:integrase
LRADVQSDLQRPVLHWTLHDIRRTVATNLQRLGVRLEVTEAILNHVSGSQAGIVKVYQRYNWMNEKREALQLWSDDLVRICDCSRQ